MYVTVKCFVKKGRIEEQGKVKWIKAYREERESGNEKCTQNKSGRMQCD